MRLTALWPIVLLAGCAATAPPAETEPVAEEPAEPAPSPPTVIIPANWPAPPSAVIPSVWFDPPGWPSARCPTCGAPRPAFIPPPTKPPRALDPDKAQRRASVGGRYRVLLRKLEVPDDWRTYGAFCDWGHWEGTSYAGATDLPPGHWVYVYPHWYLWQEPKKRRGK